MDAFGSLELTWAHGYNGSKLHFIDDNVLVYNCGNILTFISSNGDHIKSVTSEGKGIGTIAVCQDYGLIAYSEDSLEPLIYIINYPDCSVMHSLKGDAKMKYQDLAFSSDGRKLVSYSSIPDFIISIWSLDNGMVICEKSVDPNHTSVSVSFNPLNWKQLVIVGEDRVSLLSIETCDTENILTSMSIKLPDSDSPVGELIQSETQMNLIAARNKLDIRGEGQIVDMCKVYYDKTYEEVTRKVDSVIPVSYCWTPHSSIYIGCEEGQLLITDCDLCTTKVLSSPSKDGDSYAINDQTSTLPNTGHVVLHEGSLQSIALSQKGLYVGGKDGNVYLFDLSKEFNILDSCHLPHSVLSMSWSNDYNTIGIGTANGCIYSVSSSNLSDIVKTQEHYSSPFVGAETIGMDTETILTCRQDGILQTWNALNGLLISTFKLSVNCTALVCPNSSSTVLIGTEDGCLYVINGINPKLLKIVKKEKLYNTPIKMMRSDVCGRFIVVASTTGHVFVCSALPNKGIEVLGHTVIDGAVHDVSILPSAWDINSTTKIATLCSDKAGLCTIKLITLPNQLSDSDIEWVYQDGTKLFDQEAVCQQIVTLSDQASSIVLALDNSCFVIPKISRAIFKINLPSAQEKAIEVSLSTLTPVIGHELTGGCYSLSFHQRWFVSLGRDGQLLLRLVDSPDRVLKCIPHHYKTGGGQWCTITSDGQRFITIGDNQTITCWKWEPSNHGKSKISVAADYAIGKIRQISSTADIQNTALNILKTDEDDEDNVVAESDSEKTWLDKAIEMAHKTEDDKYAEQKAELHQDIVNLREKVLAMISSNERIPDIEKLDRSEFILDTEEHLRHKESEERKISSIREEIEMSNLAKMYLRDVIKRQCWDRMKVKGKVVKAFLSRLEVSNYPLKERTEFELRDLARVKTKRKIELAEMNTRREVANAFFKQTARVSIAPEDLGLEEEQDPKETGEISEPCALIGSRGDEYGGKSEYLYDQFELVTTVSKEHQIVLLQDCIRCIKESFNKEFDELLRMKESEIARINEKNVRIKKIAHDLKVNEKIIEPTLDSYEQPERILHVADHEVTVERYMSEEDRIKMDEKNKEEEERKLKEMADNWRERGLDLMMAGRLEANAEEDLFKDMPRPEFMNKETSELTEEEIRLKLDFEKKETNFLEERAKLIKSLEAEMKKNQETIQQIMETFDEKMKKLFNVKIRTEMAIQEEELKVIRLSASLFIEDDVRMKEIKLETKLSRYKHNKIAVSNILMRAKKMVDETQDEYDRLVGDDKELDKCFKRDFANCDPLVDQLYRLFKKRPRGHKLRGGGATVGVTMGTKTDNPFGPRPSSANLVHKQSVASVTLNTQDKPEMVMGELDDPENMPEGLEHYQWDRFIVARHRKVESELRVKSKALQLAEMKDFYRKREDEEDQYQCGIQNVYKELTNLHEGKSVYDMNPEIQFLLRQGQVEINTGIGYVPDFADSVLIHRTEIEEINSQIRTLGEAKLSNMNECKDFKKGICMLEWELKRLHMDSEDLIVKAKDVQMLRVTKELQERLMMDNIQRKDQNQIETLEKTFELNQKTHRRRLVRKKKKLDSLRNDVKDIVQENNELYSILQEKRIQVVERQQIQDLAGPLSSEINGESRMREIVNRSRLVELAKAQAKEVGVLRKEVERLRMRTFPALVQLENM